MATSHTSKMNDDCLLCIFHIISCQMPGRHVHKDRSSDTIRAASQVCHRWRELLLSSPLIWGRVVDLGVWDVYPGQKRHQWMEEVIRRTGSAPLWVSGKVRKAISDSRFDSRLFFIHLLQSWERIEQISVVIHGETIPDAIQSRFLSPAPMLKLFDVDLYHLEDPLFLDTLKPGSTRHLFGNYAPSLQVMASNHVAIKPNAPWLSDIREMVPVPRMLSLQETFVLLQHTPMLESVLIGTRYDSYIGIDLPSTKLNLPKLSSLNLRTTFGALARILSHICPGKLSVLRLHVFDRSFHLNDDYVIPSLRNTLPLYIASYFAANPLLVEVQLKFMTNYFELSDEATCTALRTLDLFIHTSFNDNDQNRLMECIRDSLIQASSLGVNRSLFETIIGISLYFFLPTPSNRFPILYAMLSIFDEVEYIRIDECSGMILWTISGYDLPDRVLFPKLNTLFLTTLPPPHWSQAAKHLFTGLTKFLLKKKKMRIPVQKLDLTTCSRSYYAKDLRALDEIGGLEVIWKKLQNNTAGTRSEICSYICGSGDPQKLVGIF